jgi:hypothetical protein
MEADDRRESVDCYGCGGEGGGGGRFVSWLRAEIQPLKDGVGMIVMVNEMGRKKNKWGQRGFQGAYVHASALASSFVDFEKRPRLFSALELPPNQILNYLFRN